MKKLLLVAVLLLGFSVMAVAQDTPAVEIFGGYSYMRCDANQFVFGGAEDADVDCGLHGWNFSGAINANKAVGAVIDVSGQYGTVGVEGDEVDARFHSFMFGPKFTMRSGRVTPFAQALFGFSSVKIEADEANEDALSYTEIDFSMAFGGGLDINVGEKVAIRPVQVDYFLTRSGGQFMDNFRYSAGLVIKLGKR